MGKTAPEPARRSLRVAPPTAAYEDRPRAQERLQLLPRVAAPGGPFAAKQSPRSPPARLLGDLEAGASRSTCSATRSSGLSDALGEEEDELAQRWQVLWHLRPFRRLGGRCKDRGVLELVQLNGANFGVRWRRAPVERQAAPRWMVGPHWYLMATTWSVFALLALVVTVTTLPLARRGETVTGVLLSTACLLCYALVGLSDPGIVPRYVRSAWQCGLERHCAACPSTTRNSLRWMLSVAWHCVHSQHLLAAGRLVHVLRSVRVLPARRVRSSVVA